MNRGEGRPFVHVLGGVQAFRNGCDVPIGGNKQRAVLAQLVLARGCAVSMDRLLLTLWPQSRTNGVTAALHTYISRLRRALGADVIDTSAAGYRLTLCDEAVDAWCFETRIGLAAAAQAAGDVERRVAELEAALAEWRGPAYADYREAEWARAEIARLDELHELAREGLVGARLDRGDAAAELVPQLEALVAEAPLREERWRLLTLALYRSNRQADALAALRRARETLADELGIDPGPALRTLEEQVLRQAPELSPGRVPSLDPRPHDDVQPYARGGDRLIEREHELRQLEGALDEALSGHGSVVAMTGSPGIGKSRLVSELRARAVRRGARVYAARGSALEQQFGFGVVRQLFEAAVYSHADEGRSELVSGPAAGAAAVFAAPTLDARSEDVGFAVLNALHWLTVRLAAREPLVLVVDDIHWSDLESTRYLAYLSRRVDQLPVLVLFTERSGERYAAVDLVRELEQDSRTLVVRPRPLSSHGAGALVRERLGTEVDADFVAACHEVSGGNPLLLRQLVQTLEHDGIPADAAHADTVRANGSRAVASMVLPRLRGLAPAALPVARAIAVLGDGVHIPLVAAQAGLDEEQVAAGISRLVAAEILSPRTPLGFVHPLIRDAVYSEVATGERPLLHERAARLLDASGSDPELVAAQLLHAPHRGDPWTVGALRRAAAAAANRGGTEAVVGYLRRALNEPCSTAERPEILFELGRAETARYGPAALLHLEEAYELLVEPERRATAAQQLGRTMIFAAPPGTATQFAYKVAAELPVGMSDARQAMEALARMGGHMGGLPGDLWQFGTEPVIEGNGPGAHMLRAALSWQRLCQAAPRQESIELCRTALADGSLYRADNGLLWVVATTTMDLADVDVMPLWDAAMAVANEEGSLFAALSVHLWRGFSLLRQGRLAEAMASVSLSVEEMQMWDSTVGVVYAYATIAAIHRELGDLSAAEEILGGEVAAFPGSDGDRLLIEARADVLLARGRAEEALDTVERAADLVPHVVNPAWRREGTIRARALLELGEREAAARLLERELEPARRWGAPSTLARVLRLLARAHPDDARPLLTEAVTITQGSSVRLERAKCLQALGLHLRLDEPERAARMLGGARRLLDECGVRELDQATH